MTRDWNDRALLQLQFAAHELDYLTSDDLHDRIEEPPHMNQTGAVMRRGIELRIISPTGTYVKSRRPAAKARSIKLFRSDFCKDPAPLDPVSAYLRDSRLQTALF